MAGHKLNFIVIWIVWTEAMTPHRTGCHKNIINFHVSFWGSNIGRAWVIGNKYCFPSFPGVVVCCAVLSLSVCIKLQLIIFPQQFMWVLMYMCVSEVVFTFEPFCSRLALVLQNSSEDMGRKILSVEWTNIKKNTSREGKTKTRRKM